MMHPITTVTIGATADTQNSCGFFFLWKYMVEIIIFFFLFWFYSTNLTRWFLHVSSLLIFVDKIMDIKRERLPVVLWRGGKKGRLCLIAHSPISTAESCENGKPLLLINNKYKVKSAVWIDMPKPPNDLQMEWFHLKEKERCLWYGIGIETWCLNLKTAFRTETTLVLVVNCFNPRKPLSCWRLMMVAVPPMKPVMVECDKKSTKIPSLHSQYRYVSSYIFGSRKQTINEYRSSYLRTPKIVCKIPVQNAVVKTKLRYNVGSSSGDTFSLMVEAISKDDAAMVPTARYLEVPNTAYTKGGIKLESEKEHE